MKPALDDGDVRIYHGDAIKCLRQLGDGIAQTCVTSPPYWGLRDYGVDGQLGLEQTPDEYVARMVDVFREVRRVLRDDGTLWLNLGDSYAARGTGGYGPSSTLAGYTSETTKHREAYDNVIVRKAPPGLKPKDLAGIPWRVAFALQADGWYLRSDIIWHKPNPMPESVTDRPTKSHEYVFLLSKSARYYYDAEAIRESDSGTASGNGFAGRQGTADYHNRDGGKGSEQLFEPGTGRNARTVWRIVTKPYADAHFAVFPPEIPERCIKAATSEAGQCAACGMPHERVLTGITADGREAEVRGRITRDENGKPLVGDNMIDRGTRGSFNAARGTITKRTDGWRATCTCNAGIEPQTVLDPFMGSGTTAFVARHLGRKAIGTELNSDYIAIARKRLQQLSLLGAAA